MMRSFAGLRAEQAPTTGSSKGLHGLEPHLVEEGPKGGAGPVLPVLSLTSSRRGPRAAQVLFFPYSNSWLSRLAFTATGPWAADKEVMYRISPRLVVILASKNMPFMCLGQSQVPVLGFHSLLSFRAPSHTDLQVREHACEHSLQREHCALDARRPQGEQLGPVALG